MAVRKNKQMTWFVDFRFHHTRYRKRSPENSRSGALAYEAMLKHTLVRGDPIDRVSNNDEQNQTFEQFAWRWFDTYVTPNNKFSEARIKRYTLNSSLIPFFGRMPVKDIKTYHIEQYKAQMHKDGLANKTIKNYLSVLNRCLTCAYEWWGLTARPPEIRWPKCPPPETDYLSPDECELLLSNAGGIVREMILMALRTGMRQGELKGLQWSSIDWVNRVVIVKHSRCDREKNIGAPKSNRFRSIPLDADVYEILYRRKMSTGYVFTNAKGGPLNHSWLTYYLDKVCKKAGLRRITWHVFRHTFASHLAMKGVPLNTVQVLMGHSTIMMTMRYAHVAPSAMRSAIELLNPKSQYANDGLGQPMGNQWMLMQQSIATSNG
jgi:integrase